MQLAEGYTSTPAVSFAVRQQGAAGALMVTASHNPWQWNGIKFKASYGGSAAPAIVKKIEAELPAASQIAAARPDGAKLVMADLVESYLRHVERAVDLKSIAKRGLLVCS